MLTPMILCIFCLIIPEVLLNPNMHILFAKIFSNALLDRFHNAQKSSFCLSIVVICKLACPQQYNNRLENIFKTSNEY